MGSLGDRRPHSGAASSALPVLECGLTPAGARAHLDRYRSLGTHAERVQRAAGRLVVHFAAGVDSRLVAETIAVERECCPHLSLAYDEGRRRLEVGVDDRRHHPALEGIEFALGLKA